MRRHCNSRKTYVFLDNLSFHNSRVLLEHARENKQEFIFNATYLSANNTKERLWAIAKHQFTQDLIIEANYKKKEQIKALIIKCTLKAAENELEKHFLLV